MKTHKLTALALTLAATLTTSAAHAVDCPNKYWPSIITQMYTSPDGSKYVGGSWDPSLIPAWQTTNQ